MELSPYSNKVLGLWDGLSLYVVVTEGIKHDTTKKLSNPISSVR